MYELNQKQREIQRLIMSPKMQQAIVAMQLPVLEILTLIEAEMEHNPILEIMETDPEEENAEPALIEDHPLEEELDFDHKKNLEILKRLDEDFRDHYLDGAGFVTRRSAEEEKKKVFGESAIQANPSLFQHLMNQALDTFESPEDLKMAEALIGNFDEKGILNISLREIAQTQEFNELKLQDVLTKIQSFEPIGIGATSLQECLLIQLRHRSLKDSLAYQIVDQHFEDLLHNRIPGIKKGLKCSVEEIKKAIEEDIAKLDLHPGKNYSSLPTPFIIPDVIIKWENGEWTVSANHDHIPSLRLNRKYLRMLEQEKTSKETKDFIQHKILSAKWLMQNIEQRSTTLERIAYALIAKQSDFFLHPDGKLVPLIMKTIADELELNESTIARAVMNKYVSTPRGIFSLRYFFTSALATEEGQDISSRTVRDILKEMIDGEDKKKPLSDEILAGLMKEKGINCARRTIAKYRNELNIGNTTQRRQY